MIKLLLIVAYAVAWIGSGFLMAMYFKGFMCASWKHCASCKPYERRWHKWAWALDIALAFLSIPFLIWVFK
jgi:hypothetical protein